MVTDTTNRNDEPSVVYAHEVSHEWHRRTVLKGLKGFNGLKHNRAHRFDADHLLLAAAEHHGRDTDRSCPVCASPDLREVTWVYSEKLGRRSGTARRDDEIARLVAEVGPITVHFVEVCPRCHWNFLLKEVTAREPR